MAADHHRVTLVVGNSRLGRQQLNALPKRTGDSSLSDDELLLFDMLFDSNASVAQLSSSVYPIHMNCKHNHSLDDGELSNTIDSLLSRQLIRSVGNSAKSQCTIYSLTESGGLLWERERQPNWSQYVNTSIRHDVTKGTGDFLIGFNRSIVR
ncbi:MAG: hypothetical protein AAF939_11985 [Planctomycetota bacterium]